MKRILIVDDEPLIRYALEKALATAFREGVSVADGKSALHEMAPREFDLCLLDICLPDTNGLEITESLHEISPWTRVVIMTSSNRDCNMEKSIT